MQPWAYGSMAWCMVGVRMQTWRRQPKYE